MSFASSRRDSPQAGGFLMAMWAVKAVLITAGLVSFYSLARLAVPQIASAAASALPVLGTAARAWLAPPYLFITVHLIILVIWRLSDHKHHHHTHAAAASASSTSDIIAGTGANYDGDTSTSVTTATSAANDPLKSQTPEMPPASDVSCVTTESDGEEAVSTSRDQYIHVIARNPVTVKKVVRESRGRTAHVSEEEERAEQQQAEDDSIEATWKAIMERTSRPSSAAPSPVPVRVRVVRDEPSAGTDELNRRFEDFIKKSRDQIRLQIMETTNRAVY